MNQKICLDIESLIMAEVERLSKQFKKSFLDCEDIIGLTGLGRDNVRMLMKSKSFPVKKIGKRQVVSIIGFVAWQMLNLPQGDEIYGEKEYSQRK